MHPPSEEQKRIISSVCTGDNVIVDACAGSGKSTTIFACAKAQPQKDFVLLTFNKQLQTEVQASIRELQLNNIHVYTFHGLAVKYYSHACHNDMGIRRVLRDNASLQMGIEPFDVMVLDETQDMTKVYYDLIWKFLMDMGGIVQLLILGDEKQALYGFKGADSRFLTMADMAWKRFPHLLSPNFVQHTLHTSYRITDPMGKFLNRVMLNEERVMTCKPGEQVIYVRRPLYGGYDTALNVLKNMLLCMFRNGTKYDDVFILGKSVRSENNITRMLENLLVANNIPCYIPNGDNKDELDTRVIQNKVVFSTFHAAKGRQRPNVIVVGFDNSHFHFQDKDTTTCPNELYVACTRATTKMILWENMRIKNGPLPFLHYSHMQMQGSDFIKFNGIPTGQKPSTPEDTPETTIKRKLVNPSSLIKFLSEHTLDIVSPIVEKIFLVKQPPLEDAVLLPGIHLTKSGHYEDVSDLNGVALPLMYFDRLRGTYDPVLQKLTQQYTKELSGDEHAILLDAVNNMPTTCDTIDDYLYMANLLASVQTRLHSRLKQLPRDEHTWITEDIQTTCFDHLDEVLRDECEDGNWKPEHPVIRNCDEMDHVEIDQVLSQHLEDNNMVYRFSARADLVTDTSLWELKCTGQLTIEHKLQLVIYAWLHQMKYTNAEKKSKQYYLFNVKTKELLQLYATLDELTAIVVAIIRNRYYKQEELSDAAFLEQFL